jgi:hypothetical protein
MARAEKQHMPESVDTILMYIVDSGEKPVSNSAAHGAKPVHTGTYEDRPATIHNARLLREPPALEREGFTLVDHETKVTDFYNEDEIRALYYSEMERLIAQQSGAKRVFIFDHTLRAENDATRAEKQVREPVRRVHNDYTEWSGPQRVRDLLPAEAEELLKRRFAVIQTWRPIRNPVVTAPLAVADARSLPRQDMIRTERRYPDRVGEIYHIAYNPAHRWYYFPNMRRNEAIVFKTFDSATDGRARWTAHAAFDDPTSPPDAPQRESIEIRALAFF